MSTNASSGPKIAIVGAGPAGLTLARILLQNNVTRLVILELEETRHARTQGGSLDLHPLTGQAALKEARLFNEFEKHARYEGEDFTIADNTNKIHISIKDQDTGRPEIDREKLREILLDSIPTNMIRWGAKVKTVQVGIITLSSGEKLDGFDLIVGADGAWSKVRPLLTHVKPFYSGISGYELRFANIVEKHPRVSEMLGRGSYFALGDGHCMLIQRQGNSDVKMLAAAHKPENWISEKWSMDVEAGEQMKSIHLEEYSDFAPELKDLIKIADEDYHYWPLYMLPVGLQWRHKSGATLIGDAAHLMTPFAGEGVNNAMADALSLAKLILKHLQENPDDKAGLDTAVQAYENEMFPRAERSSSKTLKNLQDRFFKAEPAAIFTKMVSGMVERRKAELDNVRAEEEMKKTTLR